jgi:hypothetical protein
VEVTADRGSLDLGTMTESSRSTTSRRTVVLRPPGRNEVIVEMESRVAGRSSSRARIDRGEPVLYVASAIDLERLAWSVRLPGGARAVHRGAEVMAVCKARPGLEVDGRLLNDRIPVEVTVRVPGHLPITYEWRTGEDAPDRILEPILR